MDDSTLKSLLDGKEIEEAKRKWASAARLLQEIRRLRRDPLENLPSLLGKVDKLQALTAELEATASQADRLKVWVREFKQELSRVTRDSESRFGRQLSEELGAFDIQLSGQHPELHAGLFTLIPQFGKGSVEVWYGPRQELIARVPLAPPKIAKFVASEQERLGSGLEYESFVRTLREAYLRVSRGKDTPASITDVLAELAFLVQSTRFREDPRADHFREYRRTDFSYDLYRFRREFMSNPGDPAVRLRIATRSETRHRRGFIWIPEDASGRGSAYSHIEVRESNE